jgi:hypothetical protein
MWLRVAQDAVKEDKGRDPLLGPRPASSPYRASPIRRVCLEPLCGRHSFVLWVTLTLMYSRREGKSMAELYCPCPERHKLWGEFWWVEGKHQWVFFDDLQTSETYAEQVERCPACGRQLERKYLSKAATPAG